MAQQIISTDPNASFVLSEPVRRAFTKIDANFTELYASSGGVHVGDSPTWTGTHTFNITPIVPADSWTYAKIQNVSATARVLGRITAGAGDIEELTSTQVTTLVNTFTTALKGLVPPSGGGGGTTFLRDDGVFAAPASGGSPGGADTQFQYNNGGAFGGISTFTFNDATDDYTWIPNVLTVTADVSVDLSANAGGLGGTAELHLVGTGLAASATLQAPGVSVIATSSEVSVGVGLNIATFGGTTIKLPGTVNFDGSGGNGVGAAGAADPLPLTPSGYFFVQINGSPFQIPFYARP